MYNERVQRIIELKEKLLEDKERQMETFRREDDRISRNISLLEADIGERQEMLSTMSFSGSDFLVFRNYLAHLDASRSTWLKEQEEVRRQIEQIRLELTELLKEIKMLETLKAKALAEVRRSRSRREQKKLDEIALRAIRG
ncbi:MAG TPA: flagellar export protein FliJ [Deltaproteobacteria bacterium]|nr:flagellar export protein FliJ [Deltaproteobacteria bacterium]